MIWDTVARMAERFGPTLLQIMQKTRLFTIDAAPQDFLPKTYTAEQCEFYKENFFLPFRYTAIEDKASLIFLFDVEKHARGLKSPRKWVEFMPGQADMKNFREGGTYENRDALGLVSEFFGDRQMIFVTWGVISEVVPTPGKKTWVAGGIESLFFQDAQTGEILLDHKNLLQSFGRDTLVKISNSQLSNALTAIEEVMYFNDPSNFIVEEIPTQFERRARSKAAKTRVCRSHEIRKYTVLKPTQIRRKLRLPEPTQPGGVRRRPHERRTHLRTYSNDDKLWPNVHGRTVVVKGSWVGPSEATVDGRRYRVMVDMRPPQLPEGS